MFCVDKAANAALLLGLGHGVKGQRRLSRRFRSVNLDYATAREAANTQCDIQSERSSWDSLNLNGLLVLAEAHDRALAKRTLDLGKSGIKSFGLVHGLAFDESERRLRHW